MRKHRGLILGLIAFVVLLALAFLQSQQGPLLRPAPVQPTPRPTSAAPEDSGRLFTGWTAADVFALRLQDPHTGATRTIQRNEAGNWFITERPQAQLDQQIADTIINTIAIMPVLLTLADIDPTTYDQYGLTDDNVFILAQVILPDREHVVAIGDVTPDARGHYALADDREAVYIVDARAVAYLSIQWRDVLLGETIA